MNKKCFLKAVLDGLVQSLALNCLGAFAVSVYASSLSMEQYLLIGALGAAISAAIYFVLTLKESSNKAIAYFTITSSLCFILCMAIILAVRLTFPFSFLPLREVNNADGILALFTIGSFILSSICLKLCVFIILLIKNRKLKNNSGRQGDSNAS